MQGNNKATSIRMVTYMQEKHNHLFEVHISSEKGKDVEDLGVLNMYSVLQFMPDLA